MWDIPGKVTSPGRLVSLQPQEVLYDFDGPRIFTALDSEGELNLAYWSDGGPRLWRCVVVPTTPAIVTRCAAVESAYLTPSISRAAGSATRTRAAKSGMPPRQLRGRPAQRAPTAGTMLLTTYEPLSSSPRKTATRSTSWAVFASWTKTG